MLASRNRREIRPRLHPHPVRVGRVSLGWLLATAVVLVAAARAQDAPRKSLDDMMTALEQEYGQHEDKFDDLAQRIEKAVRGAITGTAWLDSGMEGDRRLKDHPYLTLAGSLTEAAKSDAKRRSKNDQETKKLLTRHPWDKQLELAQSLDYGSDRPIPDNENGFINLGRMSESAGLPELPVNQYLYGFGEIVGWQYRVKAGKKLAFEGRTSKDVPLMQQDLPGWEKVRAYLRGTVPDVQLLAVPWLTHCIHTRLAELRRTSDGQPDPMDEFLALMDSRWNGFYFQLPWTKDRLAIVAPLHDLYADRKSFVYHFPSSAKKESVGDLPFISILTLQRYSQVMLAENIMPEDFIMPTPQASAAQDRFSADCNYITRYKSLIDEIVRAILVPSSPYPGYLTNFDFPSGTGPRSRAVSGRFDVPRKYALVLWAWSDKDPVKVADFLHENLLSRDGSRFPGDAVLQQQLVAVVREHEAELMQVIVDRIAADRGEGQTPGDYEREFSPYPTYLAIDGKPHSDFLVHSFQTFHETPAAVVRDAAFAVAQAERIC